ncbi:MAG: aminopeptidase P family N-terminal domain-containing protein, partial [Dongiaceae bacterium]
SETEHRERLRHAKRTLADGGFDGAIVVAPEHLFYFAGYDSWVSVNSPQALIFGVGEDAPTLVLRNVDLPLARETSWVEDIRSYHLHRDDVPALVAGIVADKRIGRGNRIAIEMQSYALTHALGLALAKALDPISLVDATELLGELRVVKSATEIAYLREAAVYADIGLEAAPPIVRAGRSNRRRYQDQICDWTHSMNLPFGMAATFVATTWPFLKIMKVGMPRMP